MDASGLPVDDVPYAHAFSRWSVCSVDRQAVGEHDRDIVACANLVVGQFDDEPLAASPGEAWKEMYNLHAYLFFTCRTDACALLGASLSAPLSGLACGSQQVLLLPRKATPRWNPFFPTALSTASSHVPTAAAASWR
jgi:hypothetical protein